MWLTVPVWTGPNSPQEEQVDAFAEHPTVRRVAADDLAWRTVEIKTPRWPLFSSEETSVMQLRLACTGLRP